MPSEPGFSNFSQPPLQPQQDMRHLSVKEGQEPLDEATMFRIQEEVAAEPVPDFQAMGFPEFVTYLREQVALVHDNESAWRFTERLQGSNIRSYLQADRETAQQLMDAIFTHHPEQDDPESWRRQLNYTMGDTSPPMIALKDGPKLQNVQEVLVTNLDDVDSVRTTAAALIALLEECMARSLPAEFHLSATYVNSLHSKRRNLDVIKHLSGVQWPEEDIRRFTREQQLIQGEVNKEYEEK